MRRLVSPILVYCVFGILSFSFFTTASWAQANITGQWTTLPYPMPINPIHVALLNNGKVVIVAGSGNVAGNTNYQAALWDPQAGSITTQPVAWDMFCNGMIVLADGRPMINGGTIQYDPFHGALNTALYDPATNTFSDIQRMAHGRWYPTVTMLGDGRVMTFSGLDENGNTNSTVEIYTPGSGWSAAFAAGWTPPLYPRMHLLPNGKVFYSGSSTQSRTFDPVTHQWTKVATTAYGGSRTYGTSVLLPLTPANNYAPRVIIMGGANPSTATTEIIELSAATPAWNFGPNMSQPRIEMSAVILPTGKVLALGGSFNDEDVSTASLNADLYDPVSNTFSSAGANAYARLYHSVALLMPDATVWVAGGNPQRGSYEQRMEIYRPAYLFTKDGSGNVVPATRPSIAAAPGEVSYGNAFNVQTPDATNIGSVVLVRAGAATHAFDMDHRLVGASFSVADSNDLTVTAPPNGNIAPPGYYMLFLVNSAGVPSNASFIHVAATPDFTVSATPASNNTSPGASANYSVNIIASNGFNGSVSFSVNGLPQGASANFNPASVTGSGSSTMTVSTSTSTPLGTYPLTITATSGAFVHTVSVNLVVAAQPDFALSATPSSRTIARKSQDSYTVTVAAINGFSGDVALTLSGLPSRTNALFSPATLTGSGNSTLTISVNKPAQPGTYALVVTGTSGNVSHSTNITLVIQ
jgi:Domain of unknown function (DUF1929)/Glyoxal oxidase N-terminus